MSISRAESAVPTWDEIAGGKGSLVEFHDDKTYDLGADPNRTRFQEIIRRTLSGQYYPTDAVLVTGRFAQENREIKKGDTLIQTAPLFGKVGGPRITSVAKIFVCEQSEQAFRFGYVTTNLHLARGIWSAELNWSEDRLTLRVKSIAMPGSLLYWMGLPIARVLQLRARRRSVEEFTKIQCVSRN